MNVTKCVCINRANGAYNLPMCDVDAVEVPSVDVEKFLIGILGERKYLSSKSIKEIINKG